MALDNLISIKLTPEQLEKMENAIAQMNEAFAWLSVNLTPEERRQYGRIADRNQVLVDKIKNYLEQYPNTQPPSFDKDEFEADYKARLQLAKPIRALRGILEKIQDTKTLLDHDNYTAAIAYYRYVKYLSSVNEPGVTHIYQDLRKHYQNAGNTAEKPKNEES